MESKGIRFLLWVAAAFFVLFALPFFPSFASVLFFAGAVLVAPIPQVREFLKGRGLGMVTHILLASAIFVGGIIAAPEVSQSDAPPIERSAPAIASEAEASPEPDALPEESAAPAQAVADAVPDADEEAQARLAAERQAEVERLAAEEKARQEEAARLEAERLAAEERARQEEAERRAEQARLAAERQAQASEPEYAFDTYDNAEQQKTADKYVKYVLNTSSKKIHDPTCRTVPKITPQNYATSNESIEALEAQEYTRCGVCNPK